MKPWTPPVAPPGLWERPEMARALAGRDMGAVSRLFRRSTGTSQTDVGMAVGVPQSHVSELERGARKVIALDLFERFADGLGIPRPLLGLSSRDGEDGSAVPDSAAGRSQRQWLETRRRLGSRRADLTQYASRLYPEFLRLGRTGLLMPANWRLSAPVDLAAVSLNWQDATAPPGVNGGERETRRLRPIADSGREYSRYHRAMRDLARPRLFENRLCYRLLDANPGGSSTQPALAVTLGEMCYFDMIDVGESLAHEIALVDADRETDPEGEPVSWRDLPFRRLLRDPFALDAYPLLISVSTLTIRRSASGASFFLLRRNPSKVAIAGGMLSVFPTGVFQPASVLRAPHSPDFDLWRNVVREYSEEFLGNPEHDGGGAPIDYENEEPFRSLDEARRSGGVGIYCLGIGLDALNYVGDLLTVAVFDAPVFDRIFDGMVERNDEGEVEARELAFEETTVRRLLDSGTTAPSGAACLQLAWEHRRSILPE